MEDTHDTTTVVPARGEQPVLAAQRFRYRLILSIEGRIRFLSHLETVDTLLSALRRAGARLALSQGMKPKPLIKVAMPRPVAVEAWSDIVEIELAEELDPDVLALGMAGALPAGLNLVRVERLADDASSAASRVAGATFRLLLDDVRPEEARDWVATFLAADELPIERSTPKQRRTVDVRAMVADMQAIDTYSEDTTHPVGDVGDGSPTRTAVRCYIRLTAEGSAKPDEVVRALSTVAGRELRAHRITRESITIAQTTGDGRVAEPALVGADVPDGPAKPWGAC